MNDLDTLFRAFQEYKKHTSVDRDSDDFRKAFIHSQTEEDSLETMRTYPEIYEDWVAKIEEEMVYVEKAVREERQFIRQDGEVVPIEKAKRVSRESVKHLAKHSNNITKEPEDPSDDIIPENIYIVENLSDYAVYENRFLYMLLCYTRDFITMRLNKILELGRTYKSNLVVTKNLNYNKKSVSYTTVLNEIHTDSESSPEFKKCQPMIKRIADQQYLVTALLSTPVMQEVSKSPMVRPPITLTNVLKKNNNFKHALDLYHYLSSYTSQGFEIKDTRTRYSPLSEKMLTDCAEIGLLQSFTAYQYGNRLTASLNEAMKEQERREKEELEKELRHHLDALRKQYAESGNGLNDYILILEQHNRMLEESAKQLQIVTAERAVLAQEKEKLTENIALLEEQVDEKVRSLREADLRHREETQKLSEKHFEEIGALQESHLQEISGIKETHSAVLAEKREKYEKSLASERETVKALVEQLDTAKANYAELKKECDFTRARFDALCQKHGEINGGEDFTSEKGFKQLETEFEAFAELFFEQWGRTKKRIRKEILFVLPEKAKKADYGVKSKRNVPPTAKVSTKVTEMSEKSESEIFEKQNSDDKNAETEDNMTNV